MDTLRKLLLVEDDDGLRSTLSANLDLSGFDVIEARNGEEAIRIAGEQAFDIMLTDVQMPGMNGVDAARQVRAARPGLPVLVMSAVAPEHVVSQALAEGAFTVIRKPFDFTHLVEILESALQGTAVLVVQDAPDATAIESSLASAGVRVRCVKSPDEALALAGSSPVDVCVLDLATVDDRALEFCESLRGANPRLAVVATGAIPHDILPKLVRQPRTAVLRGQAKAPDVIRSIALFRCGASSW